jgi:hypothetical protein
MTNKNDAARPVPSAHHARGLTKREHFAAMAMQGMLANSDGAMNENNMRVYSPDSISKLATLHADALIEALNK